MKIEQMVCTLDQAKRLKELGVKQESYFYWDCWSEFPKIITIDRVFTLSAFTCAELGEIIKELFYDFWLTIEWESYSYKWSAIANHDTIEFTEQGTGETLAEALAELLITLLEGKDDT